MEFIEPRCPGYMCTNYTVTYGIEKAEYCATHAPANAVYIDMLCALCIQRVSWRVTSTQIRYCIDCARNLLRSPDKPAGLEHYTVRWLNEAHTLAHSGKQYTLPTKARIQQERIQKAAKEEQARIEKAAKTPPALGFKVPAVLNTPKALPAPAYTPPAVPRISTVMPVVKIKPVKQKKVKKAVVRCLSCDRKATHGIAHSNNMTHCSEHIGLGMVNLTVKSCEYPACLAYAVFKAVGSTVKYCKEHAEPGMIRKGATCKVEGCNTTPSWGIPGQKPETCAQHRSPEMRNLRWKCIIKHCYNKPVFGNIQTGRARYCPDHATADMIRMDGSKCTIASCISVAKYFMPEDRYATYCGAHRPDNSFEWKKYICADISCGQSAIYEAGDLKYCVTHKPEVSQLIPRPPTQFGDSKMVLYCKHAKCALLPTHGRDKPLYCSQHASSSDRKIKIYKCVYCVNEAQYNVDNVYICANHNAALEGMLKAKCKYCDISEETERICKTCVVRSRKTEYGIVKYLRTAIGIPFTYDSSVGLGCTRARPDIMFDMPEQVLIVEVDENQHKNYSCELARINGIVNSVGGRPVTIIRFNPDAQNNDNAPIDMRGRLAVLISEIHANMVPPSAFRVKLIHLFYDGENIRAEDITKQVCI